MPDPSSERLGVLVTRPREQAEELIELLNARGMNAIAFPVLEIVPQPNAAIETQAVREGPADITIFVSPNAVRHGLKYASGRIAAIGPGTAARIDAAGREVDIVPADGYDSEHLLAEPSLASMDGVRVRIVRGNGGRELLGRTLETRGAKVHYLEVYTRRLPASDAAVREAVERAWRRGGIDFVIAMSVQSLRNLESLLPVLKRDSLAGTVLVTPAARVLKELEQSYPGCAVVLADGPSAAHIADAIESAAQSRPS